MDNQTATQRVLETPELLEMILSDLHPLQLLMLQRVNTLWNGLISHSPQLQRQLFMRADWTLQAAIFDTGRSPNIPGERPKNNRMLRRVIDNYPTFTMRRTNIEEEEIRETKGVTVPDQSHEIDVPRMPAQRAPDRWLWDINIQYPAHKSPSEDPAITYEKASWRRMYLCQPPCTELYLSRRWQRAANPAIVCETGITMEMFMSKVEQAKVLWNGLFIASDNDWHLEGPMRLRGM